MVDFTETNLVMQKKKKKTQPTKQKPQTKNTT